MKKFLLIGLIVGLVLVLVGGAGAVYASVTNLNSNVSVVLKTNRSGNNNTLPFGYGPGGMMNGYGYGPGGMMGRGGLGICGFIPSALRSYVISSFASAVGLSVDQVNTDLSNGQTLTQIANAQGFTGDKLTQLVTQVYQAALKQAVADKVITQAEADQIQQLVNNLSGTGFGPDFGLNVCPMRQYFNGRPTY